MPELRCPECDAKIILNPARVSFGVPIIEQDKCKHPGSGRIFSCPKALQAGGDALQNLLTGKSE